MFNVPTVGHPRWTEFAESRLPTLTTGSSGSIAGVRRALSNDRTRSIAHSQPKQFNTQSRVEAALRRPTPLIVAFRKNLDHIVNEAAHFGR